MESRFYGHESEMKEYIDALLCEIQKSISLHLDETATNLTNLVAKEAMELRSHFTMHHTFSPSAIEISKSEQVLKIDEIKLVENESENKKENPKDVRMQFIFSLMFILGTESEMQLQKLIRKSYYKNPNPHR